MKMGLVLIMATVIAGGAVSLAAWSNRPPDESEIKRDRADKIMCQTYGDNWSKILVASIRTNQGEAKTMAGAYESAIGYERTK